MDYPGRVIKAGEADARIVNALKVRLNKALLLRGDGAVQLDPDNPAFGPSMKQAVKLFQARHVDSQGRPLKVDGEVGAITWAALFGDTTVPLAARATSPLLTRVLEWAQAEEAAKVREVPANSNRGPRVQEYQRAAGISPGLAWCCAFVYWCFEQASRDLGRGNPMVRTGGCLAHWNGAPSRGARRITRHQAVADPALVQPGQVFIMDFGGGKGHTGLVERVQGGLITTIEGNTDASMTREGGGVYRLQRKLLDINKGFIDYSGV